MTLDGLIYCGFFLFTIAVIYTFYVLYLGSLVDRKKRLTERVKLAKIGASNEIPWYVGFYGDVTNYELCTWHEVLKLGDSESLEYMFILMEMGYRGMLND